MPDFAYELEAGAGHGSIVFGIDEVGRGPLAGPVIAAAVWIPPALFEAPILAPVTDSKKLSPARRELIDTDLRTHVSFALGVAEVEEIDRINILQATFAAMERAVESLVEQLGEAPALCLIDGNRIPKIAHPARALVKGDFLSVSIAAASIIAKVERDRLMARLSESHPGYGWERNAGYGTAQHLAGIAAYGVTPHHRRSFRPVRDALDARVATSGGEG